MMWLLGVAAAVLPALRVVSSYDIVREYSGSSFFDAWTYYGQYDNLTLGASLDFFLLPCRRGTD